MRNQIIASFLLLSVLCPDRCAPVVCKLQKLKSILLLSSIIITLVGCALNTKIESDLGTTDKISDSSSNAILNPNYKIAVLAGSREGQEFAECVEKGLRSRLTKSTIISEESFRNKIPPWAKLCSRPSNEAEISAALSNSLINKKLNDIGLDFIIYIGGSTKWRESGWVGASGPDIPFVMGYVQKERKTRIRATIVDINKLKVLGDAHIWSKGVIAIPILGGLWVPIPIGLATETSACHHTAQYIANTLSRKSLYRQNVVRDDVDERKIEMSAATRAAIDSIITGIPDINTIDFYKRLAVEDIADAQYKLGRFYYDGNGVAQDYRETFKWWLKAAHQGHSDAQYALGMMYLEGKGIHDQREATIWLKKAAEQGHAEAKRSLVSLVGEEKHIVQDKAEEFERYREEAEQGHVEAQHDVALRYYKGEGVAVDYDEAFKWFKKAAEHENAESAFMISEFYYWGVVGSKDEREAARWCLKAANLGHGKAACVMGQRYSDTIGPQSYWGSRIEEYKWLWVCSRSDDIFESERTPALFKLDDLATRFSAGTLEYANMVAKEWRPHSSPVVSDNTKESSISCTEIAGNYEGSATDNCGGRNVTSDLAVKVNSDCSFVALASGNGLITKGTLTAQSGNKYGGNATNQSGCGSMEIYCANNVSSFTCKYNYTNGAKGTIISKGKI